MNPKASYEITIADKLRQLQVPDMRDAIWNRIETQLDADLPEDDGPDKPDNPSNGGWRNAAWKAGPFAVIVAIITLFFINKNNNTHTDKAKDTQPVNTQTNTPLPAGTASPPGVPGSKQQPVINNGNTPVQQGDSAFHQPIENTNILIDTTTKPPVLRVVPPAAQSSLPPPQKKDSIPKKGRGVKGISDNDYHITLKKDSVP